MHHGMQYDPIQGQGQEPMDNLLSVGWDQHAHQFEVLSLAVPEILS